MSTLKVRWEVELLDNVLTLYDEQKVKRSTTGEHGVYTEITGVGTRVALVAGQEAYFFDDTSGDVTYWYVTSYYNSVTFDESDDSDPMLGAGQGNYITIQDLRDEGLPSTVSDSRALTLIERAETAVENFTRNFFREISGTFIFDGTNTHMLHLPLAIIEITSLTINEMTAVLDTQFYRAHDGRVAPNDDRRNPKIVLKNVNTISPIYSFGNTDKFLKGLDQTVVGKFGFLESDGSVPLPVQEAVMGLALLGADNTLFESLQGLEGVTGAKIRERTDDHEIQWADLSKQQGRTSMPPWIQNKLARYHAPRKIVVPTVRYGSFR